MASNDLKVGRGADGKDLDTDGKDQGKGGTDGNDLDAGKRTKRRYRRTVKMHPYHYLGVKELKKIRSEWSMSQRELGDLIGMREITVRCWEEGYNPIPSSVSMLLQILVDISGSRYGEEKFGLDEEISILEDE